MLVACGVDDAPSNGPERGGPEPPAAISEATDPMPSTALPLPPPALAAAPAITAPIPASTDETPPLAPGVDSARFSLEQSPARRMPAPMVFRTSLAAGLEEPTDLAVMPDATVLFTQRRRGLFVQRAGETAARRLFAAAGQEEERDSPEALAVAVDPAFDRNHFVFVYVRSTRLEEVEHLVVRLALDEAASRVTDRRTILRERTRRLATSKES